MSKPIKHVGDGELAAILRQYGRKPSKSGKPNDRSFHRAVEALIKRMRPEGLDAFLRSRDERLPQEPGSGASSCGAKAPQPPDVLSASKKNSEVGRD